MNGQDQQKAGKVSRPELRGPRRHRAPDRRFDDAVRDVVVTWKKGGTGPYASRAIANTVHEIQFPIRGVDRLIRDAIEANVPLDRVRALGLLLAKRAEILHDELTKGRKTG